MFEIVASEEHRRIEEDDLAKTSGPMVVKNKTSVIQSDGKVALVRSELHAYRPYEETDRKWLMGWRSVASFGVRTTSRGTLVPYSCSRNVNMFKSGPWSHNAGYLALLPFKQRLSSDYIDGAYLSALNRVLGIKDVVDVYPGLNLFGMDKPSAIPEGKAMAFRADNYDEFTARVFSKSRAVPALVSSVRNSDIDLISLAGDFRGLVDDSKLINILNIDLGDEYEPSRRMPNLRKTLLRTDKNTIDNVVDNLNATGLAWLRSYASGIQRLAPQHTSP